jgi:hypothetical protein
MTVEGIRVSSHWLELREAADAAARSRDLVEHLRGHLPETGDKLIHDLACGTGAMGRWLATHPPGPAADGASVTAETSASDITRLRPGDLAGATLITASALLDLMTGDELEGLIDVCAAVGCPALLTLSVAGHVSLDPVDRLDSCVAAAFDAHQRRMTAAGRLLGPDAVSAAIEACRGAGADVLVRPSPWELGAREAGLAAEWFAGWVGAAFEQDAELAAEGGEYASRRLAEARSGQLAVTVGHLDLLILP